ncbi:MAG: hypothetical protein AB7U73_25675 [Pirellulales bacterium]
MKLANNALRAVELHLPLLKQQDRDLLLKGAAIDQIAPRVFNDSIAATRRAFKANPRPRKSWAAYLHGSMAGKLRDLGMNLNTLLKAIELPASDRRPAEASA